jgi:hypothetical protein
VPYFLSIIKPKYGIGFVVFFLPLASRSMVFDHILISLPVFMVIALLMGLLIQAASDNSDINRKSNKLVNKEVIILFFLSIMISFIGYLSNGLPANVTILSNEISNLMNYTAVMVASMIFYAILIKNMYTANDWLFYIRIFLCGLLFLGVMYVLSGPLHVNLPDFLQPITVYGIGNSVRGVTADLYSQARFAGYIGYYENFVEYLVIEVALAIILIVKRRTLVDLVLGLSIMIVSLLFGFITGTRAFPILLAILFILILIIQLRGGVNRQAIYTGILSICGLGIIYFGLTFFSGSLLVNRISSMGIHSSDDVLTLLAADPVGAFFALINRADMLVYFNEIVKTTGLIGIGPLTIHTLGGTDMVFHDCYYGIYVSLGLLGLVSFLLLNLNMVRDLHQAFRNSRSEILYAICLALIITLLVDGIKVSFWRIPPTVFIYWFVFALIVSVTNLWKSGNWNY